MWQDVIAVGQWFEFVDGVGEDGDETDGDDEAPAQLPVDADLDAQHEVDVSLETLQTWKKEHILTTFWLICEAKQEYQKKELK